jgi:hypothetical protein
MHFESDHAVTGEYLLRTKQAPDEHCCWCTSSGQTVANLLMERLK